MKYIGHYTLRVCPSSSYSTTRTVLTTCVMAAMYSRRDSLSLGGTRIGGLVRSSLTMSSASWASDVDSKQLAFFKSQ